MNKTAFIFGLIPGALWSILMICMVNRLYSNPENFQGNDIVGYTVMILIFSLIFFGVRSYRNKLPGGIISFWKALKTGVLMALLAATLYVIIWLFYYYLFVPDFLDQYISHVLNSTPAADQATVAVEMNELREMYKSPWGVILLTYWEVLPIGLAVALISALILMRKKKGTNARTQILPVCITLSMLAFGQSENTSMQTGNQQKKVNTVQDSVVINATPARVWDIITNPDYAKTLGNEFDRGAFVQSEWKPGAKVHFMYEPDRIIASGTITELVLNQLIKTDYNFDGFLYSEKITLTEDGGATILSLHAGPYGEDLAAQKTVWRNWLLKAKKLSEQ